MRSHNDDLSEQVGRLLSGRPGWSLQASFSPGAPPAWCLVFEGEIDMSVRVDGGAVRVYVMADDEEVRLGSTAELTAWLDAHEAASHASPFEAGEVLDELVHGKFTKWGHPGE
jgi:hypothetical protein